MKSTRSLLLVSLLAGCCSQLTCSASVTNFVLLVADDGGYAEFGFQTNLVNKTIEFQTPHLDALAEQSIVFRQGYVSGTVCSPSRAGFLTGRYQQRFGYEYNISNDNAANDGMPVEQLLITERFKDLGYTTGVVGKWHIGSEPVKQPQNQGVDFFYGLWGGSRPYFFSTGNETDRKQRLRRNAGAIDWWTEPSFNAIPPDTGGKGRHLTDAFGDEACAFISDHAADPNGFFLYVPFTSPHGPYNLAKQQDIDVFQTTSFSPQRKTVAGMIYALDRAVGLIMDRLEDPNGDGNPVDSVLDTTVIAFFVDNGGAQTTLYTHDNFPLRGYKSSAWEGGIRVPFFLKIPGMPAGIYDPPVNSLDLFPTFVAVAGETMSTPTDGINLLPYLSGADTNAPHESLFWRQGGKWALRRGDWKLARGKPAEPIKLHLLAPDGTGETLDRQATNPDLYQELLREFTAYDLQMAKPSRNSAMNANPNDHFLLRFPDPSMNLLANGSFENGAGTDDYTYSELDAWTNDLGNQNAVGAKNDYAQDGSYRGMLVISRSPRQDTTRPIALGDVYTLSLSHEGALAWDNGDTIEIELLAVDNGSTEVLYATTASPIPGNWNPDQFTFPAVSDPSVTGKLLGLRFRAAAASGEFASLDSVSLSVPGAPGGPDEIHLNWSDLETWTDTNDASRVTLTPEDAYANLRVGIPSHATADYTAHQNLTRMTGLEFALNQLELVGTFTGTTHRTATLAGNELLFVNSLEGQPPSILLSSTSSGTATQQFLVDLDLVLYDDLLLEGDGSSACTLRGDLRDYHDPRSVTKLGASTFVLSGSNTFAGALTIRAGTVWINGASLAGPTGITVDASATLRLTGGRIHTDTLDLSAGGAFEFDGGALETRSVRGNLDNAGGDLRPGQSVGQTVVTGNYTQQPGATITVELGGSVAATGYDQLFVQGDADLDGTLAVQLVNGFIPAAGMRFRILEAAARTGVFAATDLPVLGGGLTWLVKYTPTGVELRAASPEDTDGDGLGDSWEIQYFLDLATSDGGTDNQDGDLYTDFEEWITRTHPDDSQDFLQLHIDGTHTPVGIGMQVETSTGVTYRLSHADVLLLPPQDWNEFTNFPGNGTSIRIEVDPSLNQRFYRVGAER